jgi:hypothetical protein
MNEAFERIAASLDAMQAAPAGSDAGMDALGDALCEILSIGGPHMDAKWPNAWNSRPALRDKIRWLATLGENFYWSFDYLANDLNDLERGIDCERLKPAKLPEKQRRKAKRSTRDLGALASIYDLVEVGEAKATANGISKKALFEMLPFTRQAFDKWIVEVVGMRSDDRRIMAQNMELEQIVSLVASIYSGLNPQKRALS